MTNDIRDIKKVANRFLKEWKLLKYSDMYKCTTPTYQKRYQVDDLKLRLPSKIKKFRVHEVHRVNDVIHDVHAMIEHPAYTGQIKVRIRFMKEVAPYLPSKAGEWKLDPISIKQIIPEKK